MSKIAIITDSTANLTAEYVSKHNITVVPLKIHWGEDTFEDGVDITVEAFYEKLIASSTLPTTSQPSLHNFLTAYQQVPADTEGILVITISSGISGTNASATSAASEFTAKPVVVIDSKTTSAALAMLVDAAVKAAENGASLDECAELVTSLVPKSNFYFMVDTLDYLHKGGRIGGAARFFGAALNIKPILYLTEEGKIDTLEKVRTRQQALNRLIELAEEKTNGNKTDARVVHAKDISTAQSFQEKLCEALDCASNGISDLSPVLGAHVGPGTIGLSFFAE